MFCCGVRGLSFCCLFHKSASLSLQRDAVIIYIVQCYDQSSTTWCSIIAQTQPHSMQLWQTYLHCATLWYIWQSWKFLYELKMHFIYPFPTFRVNFQDYLFIFPKKILNLFLAFLIPIIWSIHLKTICLYQILLNYK